MRVNLVVNGAAHALELPDGASLAEALRDDLALTGTKVACGEGTCGACTVLVDGNPTLLVHPARRAGRRQRDRDGRGPRRRAACSRRSSTEDAFQCGFCTPGQLMSATALLAAEPRPTPEQVRAAMSGNLCRCGAYRGIERAVLRAAAEGAA